MQNFFVNYTTIDPEITRDLLVRVKSYLGKQGNPFIDLLDNDSELAQDRVMIELEKADIFYLISTPSLFKSLWVTMEIERAKERNIPIKFLNPTDFLGSKSHYGARY